MNNGVYINGEQRPVVSEKEAEEMGYRPMTYPYHPENELWMLERVFKDLDASGTSAILVTKPDPRMHNDSVTWLEVWKRVFHRKFKS
jgi:hypothetical protein